jgi:hypothetical protein
MKSKNTLRIIFIALALLLALSIPALMKKAFPQSQTTTQAPAAPQLYQVAITRVKPGMVTEYREFVQKESLPAYRKAGVKERAAWTTATFGQGFEFIYVTPIESLGQFDDPGPLVKALGQEGQRAYVAKWARMIDSYRGFVVTARPDLSLPPKTNEAPKLALVVTHKVALGRTAEFEGITKNEVLPILGKTGVIKGMLMSKVALGGDSNEYISSSLFDSYGDIQKWATAAQMQGFGKVAPKEVGITLHRETAVYRYVPELSISPAAQKAENK